MKQSDGRFSSERSELLKLMLKKSGIAISNCPEQKIRRSPEPGPHPLSPGQAKIWLFENLLPRTPFFNIFSALHLKGIVNLAALEQGFGEIRLRHQILRTAFVTIDNKPVQMVMPAQVFLLQVVDISEPTGTTALASIERLAEEASFRSFSMTDGSLIRITLLVLGPQDCLLLVSLHHIIADGWSLDILGQELAILYEAFLNGDASSLQPLPIQFSDLARWQQQWQQDEELKAQFAFWKQVLIPPPSHLFPYDINPPSKGLSIKVATFTDVMSMDTVETILKFSSNQRVSTFMIMLATLAGLLHGVTGKTDIIVGTIVANRSLSELQELIGLLTNTILIRIDIKANGTYLDLVRSTRDSVNRSFARQDLPFDELITALEREVRIRPEALLQVMLLVQNVPFRPLRLHGLDVNVLSSRRAGTGPMTTTVDLTLVFEQQDRGLMASLICRPSLFNQNIVKLLSDCFQLLLRQAMIEPTKRISTLIEAIPLFNELKHSLSTSSAER